MQPDIAIYAVILALMRFPVVAIVERLSRIEHLKTIYAVAAAPDQHRWEIRNAIVSTPIHAVLFFIFLHFGWLRSDTETVGLAVFTFLLSLAWTEVWFYVSHWAMHQKWLYFVHREHHRSKLTTAWTSLSFSFSEKFIFSLGVLGFLALVSQLLPLSALGVFLYYVMYFIASTVGHANFETHPPGYRKSIMGKLFVSPSYHAMHHARHIKNYGLLTPWLDALFGTMWEDESEVQSRAAKGEPLRRLNERAAESPP